MQPSGKQNGAIRENSPAIPNELLRKEKQRIKGLFELK